MSVELITPRLLLRHWKPSDRDPFAAMNADPADDFEHPGLLPGHPLRSHVLYRAVRA